VSALSSLLDSLTPEALVFYPLAALVFVSAASVALSRNVLYSAFSLLGTLGGVAGLYLLLGADFVGIAQFLIYVGGILVLILFAVLLTNRIGQIRISNVSAGILVGAPAAGSLGALLVRVATATQWHTLAASDVAPAPTTARLGDAFLTDYLLPFELVSLVLLVALVGAMVIARRAAKEESSAVSPEAHDRLA
jgi:NADH-quinone oxidoreductase subunit J